MTTNTVPYCAIHGYDFSSIVYATGIDPSGGGIGVEEITAPSRKYADIRDKGRQPKKYKISARSTDRDEIEAFLDEVNNVPVDSEFYPFEVGRFGLIASAYAAIKPRQVWGEGYNFYEAEAVITCREPWLYGADKGIAYDPVAALPYVSSLLENEGQETAPINYMQASGSVSDLGAPTAAEISASVTGNVVAILDTSGQAYYSSGSVWVPLGSVLGSKISKSSAGTMIIGLEDSYPYYLLGTDFVLFSNSMTLTDISIADDGTVYGINSSKLWRWSGTAWVDLSGVVKRIAAQSSTLVYVIASDDSTWQYDSGAWSEVDATAVTDIATGSDGSLVSLQGGVAYYWSGVAWVSFGGTNCSKIANTSAGHSWMINTSNEVWQFTGSAIYEGSWAEFTATTIQYIEGLSVRITLGADTAAMDRKLLVCDRMLGDDLFEIGWRKRDVSHSWDADLSKTIANLAIDIHGMISGGSISSGVLTLDNSDYLMIPFHGPLPVSGEPGNACIELQVDALTGDGATVWAALDADLSDMAEVDHDDLVVGLNTIYIPDLEGETFVAIGIKAAASGSIDLSGIKGTVKRYVADGHIPWADPTEEFKIRVEAEAGSSLAFLEVDYNDRYYY